MIQFRLNMTGAQRRVDRVRRSRVGPNGSEHKEPSKVLRRWAGVSIAAVVRVLVVG
jgi:hypothetical protein